MNHEPENVKIIEITEQTETKISESTIDNKEDIEKANESNINNEMQVKAETNNSPKSINENNPTSNDALEPKPKRFSSVLKNSIMLFLKVYGVRIVYSLFQFYARKKSSTEGINSIFSALFNMGNLRTSLMISCLPLLFDVFKRFLTFIFKKYKIENSNDLIVFIAGFISSYIAICIEEKSKLLNYVVLAIVVRVIHSYFLIKYKDNNPFQGKLWDFIFFFVAAILMIFTNFLNPSFQPITSLFDSYANFINSKERDQMYKMRDIYRIV
jgi:hypothetical protein